MTFNLNHSSWIHASSSLHLSVFSPMATLLSILKRFYLSIYNWTVFFGWAQVMYLAVKTLKDSGTDHVYTAVERPFLLAQTAAVLEIFHSLTGLVPSPVSSTLPQISGRLYVTWGILYSFPEIRNHVLVSTLVISWSITEIIRYCFFGLKETLGFTPSWLLWLRYSTFFVMFPIGITCEVCLTFLAMPYMKESQNYSLSLGNKRNLSSCYLYTAVVALASYVPGVPHLFKHMLRQRKKALSKTKKSP